MMTATRDATFVGLLAALAALGALTACHSSSARSAGSDPSSARSDAAVGVPVAETPPSAPTEIPLTKRYPMVGDKRAVTFVEQERVMTDLAGPKGASREDIKLTLRIEKTEECLAVADQSCSRLKVSFPSAKLLAPEDSNPERSLPHDGKSYLLEKKGASVVVTDDQGKAVPKPEARLVRRACATFGRERELLDALPATLAVGQSLAGADLLLAGRDPDLELSPELVTTQLVVKAIKDGGSKKVVVLDVTRTYRGRLAAGEQLDGALTGTVELLADLGLPVRTELKGGYTIHYDGTGAATGVKGKAVSEETLTAADSYSF